MALPLRRVRRVRTVRAAVTVAAAAVLTLITAGPAPVAAGPPDRLAFAERVDLAGAVWLSEAETSSTVLDFRIFDSDQRSDSGVSHSQGPGVVLFFTRTETDPATGIVTETNYEGFFGGSGPIQCRPFATPKPSGPSPDRTCLWSTARPRSGSFFGAKYHEQLIQRPGTHQATS